MENPFAHETNLVGVIGNMKRFRFQIWSLPCAYFHLLIHNLFVSPGTARSVHGQNRKTAMDVFDARCGGSGGGDDWAVVYSFDLILSRVARNIVHATAPASPAIAAIHIELITVNYNP